jgi:hypothetical protein
MASFRHWRLNITRWRDSGAPTTSSNAPRISEMRLLGDHADIVSPIMSGFNIPAPYVVSGSSQYASGFEPWRAFDGVASDSSRWHGATGLAAPAWLQVDLGEPINVYGIALAPDGAATGYNLMDFKVLGSNTGAFTGEESTLLSVTDATDWAAFVLKTFSWETFLPLGASGLGALVGRTMDAPLEAIDVLGVRTKTYPSLQRNVVVLDGSGQITGTVKNAPSTPVRRKVLLMDEATQQTIRETWSDAVTGAYSFTHIAMGRNYTVISYDHTLAFRAVVADRVMAEAMIEAQVV